MSRVIAFFAIAAAFGAVACIILQPISAQLEKSAKAWVERETRGIQ